MRSAVLILGLLASLLLRPAPATAGETRDFLNLAEAAMRAARAATHYLRTENAPVASLELAAARKRWGELAHRFEQALPDVFEGNPAFPAVFARVTELWAKARDALGEGRLGAARTLVENGIEAYRSARRASWLFTYSDCIVEMNRAVDTLWSWRRKEAIELEHAEVRNRIAAETAVAHYLYRRCYEEAPREMRGEEFERLFSGALAGLGMIPEALAARDAGRFLRILRELRSFDRLLRFRYG